MYRFIESIYFKDGNMPLLPWHEERFAGTQIAHFGTLEYPPLQTLIEANRPENLRSGKVYKIRICYDLDNVEITFQLYQQKKIRQLRLAANDTIEYPFKYADRTILDSLKNGMSDDQEVIIVRNGLLTDTTFTNLALYDGNEWLTPAIPLLEGVRRASLIDTQTIHPAPIPASAIGSFQKIRLFNAMVSWEQAWEFPVAGILPL